MHMHISRRAVLAVSSLVVLAVALTGASVSTSAPTKKPPPSPIKALTKSLNGLSLKARRAKLVSLAKSDPDGATVNVYTSLSKLVVDPMKKEWKAEFPDISLNVYRGSSEDVTARILAERKAGTHGADVIETNGTNMLFFQHMANVAVPYDGSPYRAQIPKEYRFSTFTADRIEKFVVAWNTNLVKSPPRSWQDLANPKWKGKLAMEPTDVDWFAGLYTYLKQHGGPKGKPMTAKKVDALWRAIAQNAQIINGHTTEATLLAAGQVQVVVSGHAQSIEQLQAQHAPIAFKPFIKPVVERPQGVGISYRLPHAAAGLLFYDWLLSPAGQKILQQNGVEPANRNFPDNAFSSNPKTIRIDIRPIVSRYQSWSNKYASFTRLGSGG